MLKGKLRLGVVQRRYKLTCFDKATEKPVVIFVKAESEDAAALKCPEDYMLCSVEKAGWWE